MSRDRWIALGLALVATLLFAQSVDFGFAMDDNGLIVSNSLVKNPDRFWEIFTTDYWYPQIDAGLYRPLPKMTYALNRMVGGMDAWGFHAVNIALHALMTALVFFLLLRVTGDRLLSGLAGLLFAVLAVHTEVPANTTFGRPETMAGIFAILSMLAYLRIRSGVPPRTGALLFAASLISLFLGLLCKESSVTIIGVLALYDFGWHSDPAKPFLTRVWSTLRERFLRWYLPYCIVVALYMAVRIWVLGADHPTPPHITLDNPIVGLGQPWREINALYVFIFHYTWKMIFPRILSYDYSYDAIPMIKAWDDPRILLTVLACAAFVGLCVWAYRRSRVLFFGIMFYVITFSVVSNVILLIGTVLGERLLYFPSIGFCLVAAWVIVELARKLGGAHEARRRAVLATLALLLIGGNAARTVDRLQDWRSEVVLFTHDIQTVPRSAKANSNAGAMLAKIKEYERALTYLHRAVEINPLGYPIPYYTAALVYTTLGRDREAAEMYQRSIVNGDRDPLTRNNLGYIWIDSEIDVDQGVEFVLQAVKAYPKNADFRDSLAWGYYKQGKLDDALREIDLAIELRTKKRGEPKPGYLEHRKAIVEAIARRDGVRAQKRSERRSERSEVTAREASGTGPAPAPDAEAR